MKNKIQISYFKTPIGELILGSYEDQLCLGDWRYRKMRSTIDARIKSGLNAEYVKGETNIISETKKQLNQYFEKERKEFDIPLLLIGSDFQKQVWKVLQGITFGSAETYLGLSEKLGDKKAIRAVASANGANAISIIIPCHRIIGADGSLVGYAGGIEAKRKLLKLEEILINNQFSLF